MKQPCLLEGLTLCLYNNNSVFNGSNLLQTNGTATGAPNSCSYSDLAVEPIDESIFEERDKNFNELKYYGRFRDDCLVLWNGTNERLNDLHKFINSIDSNLQFTMEIGGTSLDFLDLRITIVDNKLQTTVYSKPTDSHLYLQAESCHQTSSVNGIQKGVALRLRRICSTDEEFESKAKEYKAYLVARGHDPFSVRKAFERTQLMPRKKAREKVNKGNCSSAIVFSTKYKPCVPNIKTIFKKKSL